MLGTMASSDEWFSRSDRVRGAHNGTPGPVSHVRITFPAEQKSVPIRHVRLEIKAPLLSMVTRGEARALVQSPALPCRLPAVT